MIFYKKDRWVACIIIVGHLRDIQYLRSRAEARDGWRGLFMNNMTISTLDVVGIPEDRILIDIEVSGFGGNVSSTLCFTNLDLTVWPMQDSQQISFIDAHTSYICWWGGLGCTGTRLFSPRTISINKPSSKAKESHHWLWVSFSAWEFHFLEVVFFYELAEDGLMS